MLSLSVTARLPLRLVVFLFILFTLILPGCGPSRGELKGKVTYKGKVVCSGSVQVAGSSGVHTSKIEPDGTYRVMHVPAGTVKIAVSSPDPATPQLPDRKGVVPPPGDKTNWFPIPERYASFELTDLTYEIKGGPNTFDLELK
jgi:hypothetical protein